VKAIDFTSGVNPLGPSNKARNVMRSRLRQISEVSTQGLNHLKSYIAKKEGVDEASILFGCGSTALFNTIIEFVAPKRIFIPGPISQRHSVTLLKYSLQSVKIPLKANENFDLTIEDFCNAMPGCDAAFVQNPHTVTGAVISQEDIIKIADTADRLNINLFIDEAYGEYTGMKSPAVHVSNSDGALILRTFSTFYALGGLRIGYVIGPPSFISHIQSKLDPSWINSLAPWAAIASMKDKGYQRRTLLFIEGEKAYIRNKASQIKDVKCFVSPSNVMVLRIRKDRDDVKKWFERQKVLIHTFTDEDGNTCIRFPVQKHRLNACFVRILKRMMEA
jgi:threonine-phosphate decarboxylase